MSPLFSQSTQAPIQWQTTADGSLTAWNNEQQEPYHNQAGAYSEAMINYVQPSGWCGCLANAERPADIPLVLWDVCFGLGYNTWAFVADIITTIQANLAHETFHYAHRRIVIRVEAFESDPKMALTWPMVLQHPTLDCLKFLKDPLEHNIYYQTQDSPLLITNAVKITPRISLHLEWRFWWGDFKETIPELVSELASEGDLAHYPDWVFHDPFSPQKVPDLWSVEVFQQYALALQPKDGSLLTYSAMGAVRGGLREAGFQLYRTGGLGKKLGGTLAALSPIDFNDFVHPLSAEERLYLESLAGIPFRNPSGNRDRKSILLSREQEQAQSSRPKKNRHFIKVPYAKTNSQPLTVAE